MMQWLEQKKSRTLLTNVFAIVALLIFWASIVISNFTPNTWLLSWDLMDSSFNPKLMIERSLFQSWQSFQGLGLHGGHGYLAQLPQAMIQYVFSLFFPQSTLRYIFAFLMLLLGGVGSYKLFSYLFSSKKQTSVTSTQIALASLIGSFFYMSSVGTVQNFYVFLEPFIVAFGLFPWSFLYIFILINNKTTKKIHWLLFFILQFFLSIIGFIPPVFISYLFFTFALLLVNTLFQQNKKENFKKSIVIIILILLANSYWLFNVIYFTFTQKDYYLESQLNQNTTQDYIERNKYYGQLSKSLFNIGFLFDSYDQPRFELETNKENYQPIFQPWINHLNNFSVQVSQSLLIFLCIIGLTYSTIQFLFYRKNYFAFSIIGFASLTLLTTNTLPFSWFNSFIHQIPVLNQAFRIPYSKISMAYALGLAFGLTSMIVLIFSVNNKFKRNTKKSFLIFILFLFLIILNSIPIWRGNFFYKGARLELPTEYIEVSEKLNKLDHSMRIALFPIYTNTGWDMHKWSEAGDGYTGSGFWWYMTPQSFLSRSFDVWSPYNESYRKEMVRSIYNEDSELFSQLVDKYQIDAIIYDKSIFLPGLDKNLFAEQNLLRLISKDKRFNQFFEGNFLQVYLKAKESSPKASITAEAVKDSDFLRHTIDPYYQRTNYFLSTKHNAVFNIFSSIFHNNNDNYLSQSSSEIFLEKEFELKDDYFLDLTKLMPKNGERLAFNLYFNQNKNNLILKPILPTISIDETIYLSFSDIELELSKDLVDISKVRINEQIFDISNHELYLEEIIHLGELTLPFSEDITVQIVADQNDTRINKANDAVFKFPNIALIKNDLVILKSGYHKILIKWPKQEYSATSAEIYQKADLINCSLGQKGEVTHSFEATGIKIVSKNRSQSCVYLYAQNTANDIGKLLIVTGTIQSTVTPKIIVKDLSNDYPMIEQKISRIKSENFETKLVIYPGKENNKGYQLVLENPSFYENSSYLLKDIILITVPVKQLLALNLIPSNPTKVIVENVDNSFFLHRYNVNTLQSNDLLITNDQSHDPGWVAFPGWRFWEQFEQVKYNGWANGWLIPGNAASTTQAIAADGESEEIRVTILYWPQLLSYVGYGLLIATLLWLGAGAWRERNTPVQTGDNSIIVDMESESTKTSGHSGKTTPHFTPLSIEKLFTGGTIGADWKIFQQEFKENTAVIANDLRTGWHKLQQAVRKVLRGRAN